MTGGGREAGHMTATRSDVGLAVVVETEVTARASGEINDTQVAALRTFHLNLSLDRLALSLCVL